MTVTKEMIEAVTTELLAHGEFGSTAEGNRINAEVAARAVLALVFVNAYTCGQSDYQNQAPLNKNYERSQYDPRTFERLP